MYPLSEYPCGQSFFLSPFPHVSLDRRATIVVHVGFHGLVAIGAVSDRVVRQPRLY
jgi:hypothetical protein